MFLHIYNFSIFLTRKYKKSAFFNWRNSIDAESTSIEVKLVGDGLTSITVCINVIFIKLFMAIFNLKVKDNGLGIPECDRQAMAMRYHTSKLSDFEGLSRVETYGFRGTTNQKINFYNIIHW